MAITVPTMYFTGGFADIADGIEPTLGYNLLIGLVGIVFFLVFNGNVLVKRGQTIGKIIFLSLTNRPI